MLPLWVISEARLDQKYGFNLQNIYISGGARLTQTVVSADIDMAATGGAVINAVLSGAELVISRPACRPMVFLCMRVPM